MPVYILYTVFSRTHVLLNKSKNRDYDYVPMIP